MGFLRKSSAEKPLSQLEILAYVQQQPEKIFFVQKIDIPVKLTKTGQKTKVDTVVLARDGRKIHETSHIADVGYGIDTRYCVDGSLDQYAKKPHKVEHSYTIDDGRSFDEISFAETTAAHTDNDDIRQAFVAEADMYISTIWCAAQFVAKGGIVTISGREAIGNNNPCDMVVHTSQGNGTVVLTKPAVKIRENLQKLNLPIDGGLEKFLSVAEAEDKKNPYLRKRRLAATEMKKKAKTSQEKINTLIKSAKIKATPKMRGKCQKVKNCRD